MKSYVLGFMFTDKFQTVLLIKKNRPQWQAGKLNGIGGHVEPGESPLSAIVREVREETDLDTVKQDWCLFGRMCEAGEFVVHCYVLWHCFDKSKIVQKTDEELKFCKVSEGFSFPTVISNLSWLIPMALDRLNQSFNGSQPFVMELEYHKD